jgi:hypothetical protein
MSAANPAFAKVNCNETVTVCSGGVKAGGLNSAFECGALTICNGGNGHRTTLLGGELTNSGGGGQFDDGTTLVGGGGGHSVCGVAPPTCSADVGGSGQHDKGPGGNSD